METQSPGPEPLKADIGVIPDIVLIDHVPGMDVPVPVVESPSVVVVEKVSIPIRPDQVTWQMEQRRQQQENTAVKTPVAPGSKNIYTEPARELGPDAITAMPTGAPESSPE